MSSRFWPVAVLSAGCMTVPASARSTYLPTGDAPGPTLVLSTQACAQPVPASGAAVAPPRLPAIVAQLDSYVKPQRILDLGAAGCELAGFLLGDAGQQWPNHVAPPEAVAAARAAGARSLLVAFAWSEPKCAAARCWEREVYVAAMLFDADGHPLWLGQKVVVLASSEPQRGERDLDEDPLQIFAGMPLHRS